VYFIIYYVVHEYQYVTAPSKINCRNEKQFFLIKKLFHFRNTRKQTLYQLYDYLYLV